MKKVDDFMKGVDFQVERHLPTSFLTFFKKYFVYFSSFLLVAILGLFVYQVLKERPQYLAAVIQSDLGQIEKHLATIDKDCNILSINSGRVYIDFLNVEKFSGSMVGGINLAYAEKWTGPYMKRSPTLQGVFYEIVKTREGIYIVPGQGVKLPNGMVVGKHFDVTYASPMAQMLKPGGQLHYKGDSLARKIKFKIGDWDSPTTMTSGTIETIRKALKEFNDALPFAQNKAQQDTHTC